MNYVLVEKKEWDGLKEDIKELKEALRLPKEYLNTKEAAEYIGLSYGHFMEHIVPKNKVRYKRFGTKRVFRKQWLDDYMEMTL